MDATLIIYGSFNTPTCSASKRFKSDLLPLTIIVYMDEHFNYIGKRCPFVVNPSDELILKEGQAETFETKREGKDPNAEEALDQWFSIASYKGQDTILNLKKRAAKRAAPTTKVPNSGKLRKFLLF
ncbi:hypothetical protein RF11_01941 [Thelohanellus kitauei]|uniref:Uncharacterized protein n=1 Tax=Thelohanellus kitauei TaxID=669202 RepID=A0A0C2J533_THEKT|nr:hypothetical protein RF11_01941 [Thelohanellus kitauei]